MVLHTLHDRKSAAECLSSPGFPYYYNLPILVTSIDSNTQNAESKRTQQKKYSAAQDLKKEPNPDCLCCPPDRFVTGYFRSSLPPSLLSAVVGQGGGKCCCLWCTTLPGQTVVRYVKVVQERQPGQRLHTGYAVPAQVHGLK